MSYDTAIHAVVAGRRRRRSFDAAGWSWVEIVGEHESGRLILRETGRFWPGVWLADRDQVRIAGPEFEVAR